MAPTNSIASVTLLLRAWTIIFVPCKDNHFGGLELRCGYAETANEVLEYAKDTLNSQKRLNGSAHARQIYEKSFTKLPQRGRLDFDDVVGCGYQFCRVK